MPAKSIDFFVVSFLVVLALMGGVVIDWGRFTTLIPMALLIFGLPSVYLLWRDPENIKESVLAALIFGLLFGFPFDFVATYAGAWTVNPDIVLFPYSIFGVAHIDEWVWFFFWALFIVSFYEHFVEKDGATKVSPKVFLALLIGLFTSIATIVTFFVRPDFLLLPFPYFILGTMAVVPLFIALAKNPKLYLKFILIAPFFFCVFLAFEIVALWQGWWHFEGQYIGWVDIAGLGFSLEEFIIWIVLSSAVIAAYHELFIDDGK